MKSRGFTHDALAAVEKISITLKILAAGFSDFSTLAIAGQSLVLALALHLKNSSRRTMWESKVRVTCVRFTASDPKILEKLQSLTGLRVAHIIRYALRALLQRIEGTPKPG